MNLITELLFPSIGLLLMVKVDLSLEASIKVNGAENVAHAAPDSKVSVEHELQALVKTGALPSTSDHSNSHVSRSLGQQRIDPADLARAATMVEEVEAKARETKALKPQLRSEQKAPAAMAGQPPQSAHMTEQTEEDPLAGIDLTPRAIAEYLLITGDFGGFEQAMGDLLNADVVSQKEATSYKDAVGWEYEALLYKLVSSKAASLEEFMESGVPTLKSNSLNGDRPRLAISKPGKAAAMLPPHKVAPSGLDMHERLRQLRVRALLEKESTLDELIDLINKEPEGNGQQGPAPGMRAPVQQYRQPVAVKSPVVAETGGDEARMDHQSGPENPIQPVDMAAKKSAGPSTPNQTN